MPMLTEVSPSKRNLSCAKCWSDIKKGEYCTKFWSARGKRVGTLCEECLLDLADLTITKNKERKER